MGGHGLLLADTRCRRCSSDELGSAGPWSRCHEAQGVMLPSSQPGTEWWSKGVTLVYLAVQKEKKQTSSILQWEHHCPIYLIFMHWIPNSGPSDAAPAFLLLSVQAQMLTPSGHGVASACARWKTSAEMPQLVRYNFYLFISSSARGVKSSWEMPALLYAFQPLAGYSGSKTSKSCIRRPVRKILKYEDG